MTVVASAITSSSKTPWIETPLIKSAALSNAAGCNVFLKLENLQPSGSFKSRGIGNLVVSKLAEVQAQAQAHDDPAPPGGSPRQRAHFYCSSGGNAGLACVQAAVTLGCEATIVVPLTTTQHMVEKLRRAGAADVIRKGASWQEANSHVTDALMVDARARGQAAIYVHPFDAPEVWDGNAAITREIARQFPAMANHYPMGGRTRQGARGDEEDAAGANIDAIVCSVGGGGLFSGIMQGIDELGMRDTTVIAVETKGADSLAQSIAKGENTTLPAITSLATSLGARKVCQRAFEYGLRDSVSSVVLSDGEAIAACKRFLDEDRLLVELACGLCPAICYNGQLASLVPNFGEGSNVVLVICGGSNMSLDIMDKYVADEQAKATS